MSIGTQPRQPPRGVIIREAEGRWASLLAELAPQAQPAIDRLGHHVTCPVTDHRRPRPGDFRLYADFHTKGGGICTCMTAAERSAAANGFGLLAWLNGWSVAEAYTAVARCLGLSTAPGTRRRPPPPPPRRQGQGRPPAPVDTGQRRRWLQQIWAAAAPAALPAAARLRCYLGEHRGLATASLPDDLRLHPALDYREADGQHRGPYPVMLARVVDLAGELVGLHRTYLRPDGRGKAPVAKPKRLLTVGPGVMRGAAIRLGPAGSAILHLCEGIETGLAVRQVTGEETWACVATTFLTQVALAPAHRRIIIWADRDRDRRRPGAREPYYPGLHAALALAERLRAEGREVQLALPSIPIPAGARGIDWADVLTRHGPEHFPCYGARARHRCA